jgi:hypothetical protein
MLRQFVALLALGLGLVGFGAEAQINVPFMHFPSSDAYGYGSYINIQLGSNNQAVSVLVDTGSSTLAVPPTSCSPSQSGCSEVDCVPQCPLQSGLTSQQLGSCAFGGYDSSTSTSAQNMPLSQCSSPSPTNSNLCGFSVSYGQSAGGCCGMQVRLVWAVSVWRTNPKFLVFLFLSSKHPAKRRPRPAVSFFFPSSSFFFLFFFFV